MVEHTRKLRKKYRRTRRQRGGALFDLFNKDMKPLCQCPRTKQGAVCNNYAIPGSLFCKEHQNCNPPPLTGSELKYNPNKYNKDPAIRKTHNCLSYALGIVQTKAIQTCRKMRKNCRRLFQQPGNLSGGHSLNKNSRVRCNVITSLLLRDYPSVKPTTFYDKCPANHFKIASVVDKGNDHHWYRQNDDGTWSHKSGERKVTNVDAKGRKIFNPKQASRDYTDRPDSNINYEDFCGFYCAPRDLPGPDVSKMIEERL
jgi:hypothetical protein